MLAWKKLPKNHTERGQDKNKSSYISKEFEKASRKRYYQTPSLTDSMNYRTKPATSDERTIRKHALTERGEKRRFDFLGVKQEKKTVGERTPTRKQAGYNVSRNLKGDYSPIRNTAMMTPRRAALGLNERLQNMGIKIGALESQNNGNYEKVETIVIQKRKGVKRNHSLDGPKRSGSLKANYVSKSGKFYNNGKGYVFTPMKGTTERVRNADLSSRSIKTSKVCCFFYFLFWKLSYFFLALARGERMSTTQYLKKEMGKDRNSLTASEISKRRSLTPSVMRTDNQGRRAMKLSHKTPAKDNNVNPYLTQIKKKKSPAVNHYQETSKKTPQVHDKYTDWYKLKKTENITPFAVYQNFESTPKVRRSLTPKLSNKQGYTSAYPSSRGQGGQYVESSRRAVTPSLTRKGGENLRLSKTEHQNLNSRREEYQQPNSFSTTGGSIVTNVNQSFGYGGLSKSFLEKISNQEFNEKDMEASFKKYLKELTNQVVHARSLSMKLKSLPFRGSTDVPFTKNSKPLH